MRRFWVHSAGLCAIATLGLGGAASAGSALPEPTAAPEPTRPAAVVAPDLSSLHDPTTDPDGARRWQTRIASRLATISTRARPHGGDLGSATAPASLVDRLDRLVSLASRSADVAITVRELGSGAVVFDHHGDEALNPASNHKILTAVAAVELLGADYRFETRVARRGDTLYLVGQGDPSLQVEGLEALADAVADAGSLTGVRRIVIDDTAFSSRRFAPGYDPDGPGYSWMAPSGALSLQFNTVEIDVVPTTLDAPAAVHVRPDCAHVRVASSAQTARRGWPTVQTHADGKHTIVEVEGTIRHGREPVALRRRIADPGRFTGTTFAVLLAERLGSRAKRAGGYEDLAGPLPVRRGRVPTDATTIATHRSAPLSEVLASALKYSNNFTTEQVLRTLGWRMSGRPGDWDNGSDALRRFWKALGLDATDLSFENASGLSRSGRVTARALVDLLELTVDGEHEASELWASMPVAGREGTLRRRLRSTDGRVRAKTGTLRDASALSGVVLAPDGEPRLGFSILVNGDLAARRSRRLQDRMVAALVAHVE